MKPEHAETFDRLREAADEVLVMPHDTANRQAYESANRAMLERADRLVAVWNGQPPGRKGEAAPPTWWRRRARPGRRWK